MANLTAEILREFLHYDPDTGVFTWRVSRGCRHLSGTQAGHVTSEGYVNLVVFYRQYKAHRLVWLYVHGEWPSSQLDHINRIRSDNRLANLRPASQSQNKINSGVPRNSTSGFKGASFHRASGRWQARIGANGKRIILGYYSTAEEAGAAYKKAAHEIYGEFARSA